MPAMGCTMLHIYEDLSGILGSVAGPTGLCALRLDEDAPVAEPLSHSWYQTLPPSVSRMARHFETQIHKCPLPVVQYNE